MCRLTKTTQTQAVLPRLETDLLEIFLAVTENRLGETDIKWSGKKAVCLVLASEGYPGSYEKGRAIDGLHLLDEDILAFHSATASQHICDASSCRMAMVTSGGRVLSVTALAGTHEEAREKAYANAEKITFEGMLYRKDIGLLNKNV